MVFQGFYSVLVVLIIHVPLLCKNKKTPKNELGKLGQVGFHVFGTSKKGDAQRSQQGVSSFRALCGDVLSSWFLFKVSLWVLSFLKGCFGVFIWFSQVFSKVFCLWKTRGKTDVVNCLWGQKCSKLCFCGCEELHLAIGRFLKSC